MKHKRGLFLFLVLASWVPPKASASCIGWDKTLPNYDPKYYSVSHEFRRAKFVITATAVGETWLGEDGKEKPLEPPFMNGASRPWGFDPYLGAYYDIQVHRAFKGAPPPRLRVFSENTTARFWLKIGDDYLLFVDEGTFDVIGNQLTVDTCGNSADIAHAHNALCQVQKLSSAR
jgi:hypothetical protein